MRGLVQRVSEASVSVSSDGELEVVGAIGHGLCVFVGVTHDDTDAEARKLADKIWGLRVIDDDNGVMNRSIAEAGGEVLVVSQFTLYGDTSGGRRPSWINAARPEGVEGPRQHPGFEDVIDGQLGRRDFSWIHVSKTVITEQNRGSGLTCWAPALYNPTTL